MPANLQAVQQARARGAESLVLSATAQEWRAAWLEPSAPAQSWDAAERPGWRPDGEMVSAPGRRRVRAWQQDWVWAPAELAGHDGIRRDLSPRLLHDFLGINRHAFSQIVNRSRPAVDVESIQIQDLIRPVLVVR